MSESLTKIYKPKVRFQFSNRYNFVKEIVKKINYTPYARKQDVQISSNVGIGAQLQ